MAWIFRCGVHRRKQCLIEICSILSEIYADWLTKTTQTCVHFENFCKDMLLLKDAFRVTGKLLLKESLVLQGSYF